MSRKFCQMASFRADRRKKGKTGRNPFAWLALIAMLAIGDPVRADETGVAGGADTSGGPVSILPQGDAGNAPVGAPGASGLNAIPPSSSPPDDESGVRNVSGVPGVSGDGGIQVGELGSVSDTSQGLLSDAQGGYGDQMWQGGADATTLAAELINLPVDTGSPVMTDMVRRLLLTGAQPPAMPTLAKPNSLSVQGARLEKLIEMGDVASVLTLSADASARKDPNVAVARARAALASGDNRTACDLVDATPVGDDPSQAAAAAFGLELSTFCQIVKGQKDQANLSLDLAREEGLDDPLFFALASKAASGITLKSGTPSRIDEIDYALIRFTGDPLPANITDIAAPSLLAALAGQSDLRVDQRIGAAERAVANGVMNGADLAKIYQSAPFTPADIVALKQGHPVQSGVLLRALLYQSILNETDLAARADLLTSALVATEKSGGYLPFLQAVLPVMQGIEPSAGYARYAPVAARAFLYAGDFANAQNWYAVLKNGGPSLGRDLRELGALLHVADGNMMPFDVGIESADIGADIHSGIPDYVAFATLEAELLNGLGMSGIPSLSNTPLNPGDALNGIAPDRMAPQALQTVRPSGSVGETVLVSLVALGRGGPTSAAPPTLVQIVGSLKAVGLENDARRIAAEALLARSRVGRG